MNIPEFSTQFDILYNNIMSNNAPGLDEYEKSVCLTKAQMELVKNYFNPLGNKYKTGFEQSIKRLTDFSTLILAVNLNPASVSQSYKDYSKFDDRSIVYAYPKDFLFAINDTATETEKDGTVRKITIASIDFGTYTRLMNKPYKQPHKDQAWKLFVNPVDMDNYDLDEVPTVYFEVITHEGSTIGNYKLRYVRKPRPIILEDLSLTGTSINGETAPRTSELNPEMHDEILQRAVEIAKGLYPDDINTAVTLGGRSE